MELSNIEELKQNLKSKFQDNKEVQTQIDSLTESDLQALQNKSEEEVLTFLGSQKTNDDEITVNENNQNDTNPNTPLNVDELLPETNQNEDWKDRIRAKEKETNEELGTYFQEVTTDDKSAPLTFKDDKGNTHEFSDENHCRVAGDQLAFDQLARTAKKLGKDAINFGEFKEHPEYRTRLYLACLKEGLKAVGNVPSHEEIENSPEKDAILKELGKNETEKKILEVKTNRARLNLAEKECLKDTEYVQLIDILKKAEQSGNTDDITKAKENLAKNQSFRNLNDAKANYTNSVMQAKETYIEFGRKNGPEKTKEERAEEMKKYEMAYNQKEEIKKQPNDKNKQKIPSQQQKHNMKEKNNS